MTYRPETYRTLIDEVGEGGLADLLLKKWMKDDDADDCWGNLAGAINSANPHTNYGYLVLHEENRRKQISAEKAEGSVTSEESPLDKNAFRSKVKRWKVIVWYLSHGYSNEAVAAQISCGVATVKEHLRRAKIELNLKGVSQTQLVAEAIRRGIIP